MSFRYVNKYLFDFLGKWDKQFFFYKKIKENIELFFYRLGQNDMVYIKTTLFWDELVFDGELINGYEQKDILPNDR